MVYEVGDCSPAKKKQLKSRPNEGKPATRCLLCDGQMKMVSCEGTSYFQCQKDPTHRMSLTEWSDLRDGGEAKEKVTAAMEERRAILLNKERR